MAKNKSKTAKFSAETIGTSADVSKKSSFYFSRENYKWMLIGLGLIVLGFVLMMGPDANTVDGKFELLSWL